ncbi:MAG: hypothetical protein Q4P15_12505 [Propionibacteriaceae bacterium]|nr:hypothetical protein [Propionibacteriaceae bacterium]
MEGESRLRVLFVCTANIARSPYAERRTAMLLADHSVDVASVGVRARGGKAMDEAMAAELVARGGSGQGHLSRQVDDADLAAADLIITLGYSHHMDLLRKWPQHADRIVGLRQLALAVRDIPTTLGPDTLDEMRRALPAASMTLDVADPYGRGKKAAAVCASEIDGALDVVAPFLARLSGDEPRLIESEAREVPASKSFRRFFSRPGE